MLESVSLKNFKVFTWEKPTVISFKAKPYFHHPEHILDNGLLKAAVIFGDNSTGKSKLIDVIEIMRNYALGDELPSNTIFNNWTGPGADKDVELSMNILLKEGSHEFLYRYSLVIKKIKTVCALKIPLYRVSKESLELLQQDGESGHTIFNKDDRGSNFSKRMTEVNVQTPNEDITRVLNWMEKDLKIIRIEKPNKVLGKDLDIILDRARLKTDETYQYNISEAVGSMDVGISKVFWDEKKNNIMVRHRHGIPTNQLEHQDTPLGWPSELKEESEGTRRIVNLSPALIPGSEGKTYVIDELNRKLHPDLTWRFIELFVSNPDEQKQLIFTSHETRLLSDDKFRRDEVWLLEKQAPTISTCVRMNEKAKTMWDEYNRTLKRSIGAGGQTND